MIIEIVSAIIILYVMNRYFSGTQFSGHRPDLKGKVAVVTGGNTGIGKETALDLAKQGCQVIIGARDCQKSKRAVEEIKKKSESDRIQQFQLDLADRESIKEFSKNIKPQKIDFLINNAGVMALPKKTLTKQGLQFQYAVNHLGHFYLTYLLYPKLQKSEFFRIINVSSLAHKKQSGFMAPPKLNFEDMNFEKTKYLSTRAYSYSKMYNVLFTQALAEKINPKKGVSYSLHPGVVRTELIRYAVPPPFSYLMILIHPIYCIFSKSAFEGAQTTLHLAYTPVEHLKNGGYYADCAVSSMNKEMTKQNWDKLWQISERDLGVQFKL